MRQRLRPGGIELFHDVAPPAKGAEGHAAADIFSERLEIRRDAELAAQALGIEPRCHHLIEDQDDAALRRLVAQHLQIGRIGGKAAAAAEHRLDQHRRQIAAMLDDQLARRIDVIERRQDDVIRRIHGRSAAAEIERAAMIAALDA